MSDLNEYRTKLNQTDDALLHLFLHRMQIAKQIGAYKQGKHLLIVQPQREEAVLTRICMQTPPPSKAAANLLFSLLMQLSRSTQFMDCTPSEHPASLPQPWIETRIIRGQSCTDIFQKIALCAFSYTLTLKKLELICTDEGNFEILVVCEVPSAQSFDAFCAELTQNGYDIQPASPSI